MMHVKIDGSNMDSIPAYLRVGSFLSQLHHDSSEVEANMRVLKVETRVQGIRKYINNIPLLDHSEFRPKGPKFNLSLTL